MSKLIFSEKVYADQSQGKRYHNLESVFLKDDDGQKSKLCALCVGERRYFDNGTIEDVEYALSLKTTVCAAAFRRAKKNLKKLGKGKPVYSDNYWLAGVCNDVVRLKNASLATAAKELLRIGYPGHLSIHPTVISENGISIDVNKTIHLFLEPFKLLDFEKALKLCNSQEATLIETLHKQGCKYFSLYDNGNFAALTGECHVVSLSALCGWAGIELPPPPKQIILPLWLQDDLLN